MTDAQGHTLRDERDELIEAFRERERLRGECEQEVRLRHADAESWIRRWSANGARLQAAERALAETPPVRAVDVVVMEATSHACGSWAGVEAADKGCDLPIGTRATLLVRVRP